jgi:predicted dehydrogenase
MVGFNYIRTPASRFARKLIADGAIGDITWFRGEHTEDFYADPEAPASWRTKGLPNGAMGDLAPHMINAPLRCRPDHIAGGGGGNRPCHPPWRHGRQ